MSGAGFTKLVPEIVQSSIWNESAEVRCVWIAILAIKDKDGNVRGSAATMARIANVPLASVVEALDKFQSPDPDSNTPDNEGRRLVAVPGGWHVVNHAIYRGRDYREVEAERKREYRKKKDLSGTSPGQVPDFSVSVSSSVSEGDSKGETPTKPKRVRKKKEPEEYTDDFCRFWDAYPRKANKRYAWESWQGALDRPPLDRILLAVEMQSRQDSWLKDGGQYIPHPSTWLNRGGWDDVPLQSRVAHSLAGG
jgi:hypothetical protein